MHKAVVLGACGAYVFNMCLSLSTHTFVIIPIFYSGLNQLKEEDVRTFNQILPHASVTLNPNPVLWLLNLAASVTPADPLTIILQHITHTSANHVSLTKTA